MEEIITLNHVHSALVKKSVATSISMWMRMNSHQVTRPAWGLALRSSIALIFGPYGNFRPL